MAGQKYIAYVGTYTHTEPEGIQVYDVDVEKGLLKSRTGIVASNVSHMVKSNDNHFLYAISDGGIESFEILANGTLRHLGVTSIRGMRGCYLSVTKDNKYIACAGYHDGKVTVLHVNENGMVGDICAEAFHHGMGSVAEKNFRPHVCCVEFTPDERFLCAVDSGLDQVKIYSINKETSKFSLIDIIRCEIDAGPRRICFSKNGKFCYILCEASKTISIFTYEFDGKNPKFEYVDKVSTVKDEHARGSAASALVKSHDEKYLMCSNDGDNSVVIYSINDKTGMLEQMLDLPVSGHYPKEVAFFPDDQYILSLNHESGTMTTLAVDYKEKVLYWRNKPLSIHRPNCVVIVPLQQ